MNLITKLSEVQSLLDKYAKRGVITNNFLLNDSYNELITCKKLYYINEDSSLYIIEDRGDFYQLYYHINDIENFSLKNKDFNFPVVMEILYRGENKKPIMLIEKWKNSGFQEHIIRENMMGHINQLNLPLAECNNVSLKFASEVSEISYITNLIDESFDKYTGDIYSLEEISNFAADNEIVCAYIENNLVGFIQFEVIRNVAWIGHVAVDSRYRGLGIANKLIKSFIKVNNKKGIERYQLWVMQENKAAINMYEKYGFVYANKSTVSLIKY